ncbi:hypothetical protein SDC9_209787 [bioreactor metagenome]|uniref:Uncharacterized protein n=1 Tax=bioreactor metagenome TaxID=1076179 RepID=A0A645JEK9_9ZZZZ
MHTHYQNRSQLFDAKSPILRSKKEDALSICVTLCTKQSQCPGQELLGRIVAFLKERGWTDNVNVDAAFSSRPEADGTISVTVGDVVIPRNGSVEETFAEVKRAIENAFKK